MIFYTESEEVKSIVSKTDKIVKWLEAAIYTAIDSRAIQSTDSIYSEFLRFMQNVSSTKSSTFWTDSGKIEAYQKLINQANFIANRLESLTGIKSRVDEPVVVPKAPGPVIVPQTSNGEQLPYTPSNIPVVKSGVPGWFLLAGIGLAIYLTMGKNR
jgi:hypothetical protein